MSDIPSGASKIQQEAVRFRSSISESILTIMGAAINYLIDSINPVGTVVASMLTEAQFQSEIGSTNWILADGRSVSGSTYSIITGNSTVPDLRGVFIRGKNNGRSGTTGNPDGDSALGFYQADEFEQHKHTGNILGTNGTLDVEEGSDKYNADPANFSMENAGGNETRPRNVTLNHFIRVN